jgi:serine/threonine protein kinase
MTPDRHRQISQIFDDALRLPPKARPAFLDRACAEDLSLRAEVQSLLAAHDGVGEFLEHPAMDAVAKTLARTSSTAMALTEGVRLGSYEVLSRIGAGGMGEVYSARDTQLGRTVALKLLRTPFTLEADRLRRFQQEARAVSALNHPNIVTIHEIGCERDLHFIAYELVEGETLRTRIQRSLKLVEALDVAIQIVSALIAAHAAGVIHRDLKPENIMVRPDGYVKVLDFGLAKLKEATPSADTGQTQTGLVMGTFGYMSPEQARGLKVDTRSDIFSFGVVLYEMVTGRRPFDGPTISDVIAAILVNEPPQMAQYAAETPAELQRIVTKTLAKDADERYQTANDLWLDLKELRQTIEVAARLTRKPGVMVGGGQPQSMTWSKRAAALILVATAISGMWSLWRSRTPTGPVRLAYTQLTNFADSATSPSLSPDGRMVTFIRGDGSFVSAGQIHVKILPDGEPKQLTQDNSSKMSPVFSPDGSRIAYTTVDDQNEWDTWEVPVLGAPPRRWLPNASGLVWIDRQNLLFSEKIRGSKGNHMKVVAAQESRAGARDLRTHAERGDGSPVLPFS